MTRNFSTVEYVNRVAEEQPPSFSFRGEPYADWASWRRQFLQRLRTLWGRWPQAVLLDAQTVERHDAGTFMREKGIVQTERHMAIPTYVLIPADRRPERGAGCLPSCACTDTSRWTRSPSRAWWIRPGPRSP